MGDNKTTSKRYGLAIKVLSIIIIENMDVIIQLSIIEYLLKKPGNASLRNLRRGVGAYLKVRGRGLWLNCLV